MAYQLLADLVLLVHVTFVIFVLLGGLLALKHRFILWLHLPAVMWGAFVEFSGGICPLTPLEGWLRTQAGEIRPQDDFIAAYFGSILYPEFLTANIQLYLGSLVIVMNAAVYWWLWRRRRFAAGP
jgi:hypothetical protein